jgi:hypothetical protein
VSDTPLPPPPAGWTPGENVIREALKAITRNALRPENLERSLDDAAARLAALDRRRAAEWVSSALLGLVLPLFDAAPAYGAGGPTFGTARNPAWDRESREFLRQNPHCVVCGTTAGCAAHHKYPVHLYPELEMDRRYWRTACPRDHFFVCHVADWKAFNPDVDDDAVAWQLKIHNRPYHRVEISG